MTEPKQQDRQDLAREVSPALRVMLIEWRRARITEANAIGELLHLGRVIVVREDDDTLGLDM